MKLLSAFTIVGLFISGSALAEVNVKVSDEISVIAANGEELGLRLFDKKSYQFDDGVNQLLVRVSKLVRKPNGEFEKFDSDPVIVTFSTSNDSVFLKASEDVETVAQGRAFNKSPQYSMSSNSDSLQHQVDILPRAGGITRDYEKEIIRYNNKRNIVLKDNSIDTPFSSSKNEIDLEQQSEDALNSVVSSAVDISELRKQYLALTDKQRKDFLSWAVSQ